MVATITVPVVVIGLVIGYCTVSYIVNGVSSLFKEKKSEEDKDKRD